MKSVSIKPKQNISWPILAGTVAIAALAACSTYAADTFDPERAVATPTEKLQFENINPAISMADAYGNKGAGAHGTFGRFPANFETPEHTHTGAYHGIVIKGTMTNPFNGEKNPPKLNAGSYWYVPAGMIHTTACVSSTPCEFYFHADSAFDFMPVKK